MENEPLRAYKTNTHRENVVFHFLQMKSFAISAHPPVSLVTNNSQIWMQITYLKGPNGHSQYNASFWSIVLIQVYNASFTLRLWLYFPNAKSRWIAATDTQVI